MRLLLLPDHILGNILSYLSPTSLIPLSFCSHRLYQLITPRLQLSLSIPSEPALLQSLLSLLNSSPSVGARVYRLSITEPVSHLLQRPLFSEDLLTLILSNCPNVVDLRLGVGKANPNDLKFYQMQRNISFPWELTPSRCGRLSMITLHDYGDEASLECKRLVKSGLSGLTYLDLANCALFSEEWKGLAVNMASTLRELYLFNSCREPYIVPPPVLHLNPFQLELIARSFRLQVFHFRPESPLTPDSRNQLRDALFGQSYATLHTVVIENIGRIDAQFWKSIARCSKLELLILTDGTYFGEVEDLAFQYAVKSLPLLKGLALDANRWEIFNADWAKRVLGSCPQLKWLRLERVSERMWHKWAVKEMERWRDGWASVIDGGWEWRQDLGEEEVLFDRRFSEDQFAPPSPPSHPSHQPKALPAATMIKESNLLYPDAPSFTKSLVVT